MAKREKYSELEKWNVKDLYENLDEYTKDYEKLKKDLDIFLKYKGHLLDSAEKLYEFLEFDVEFSKMLEQVYVYAHIKNDEDTSNTKNQTMYQKAFLLYQEYGEATSFVLPEILKSKEEVINNYLKEYPFLKKYEKNLHDLYKYKKYTLSDKEENILSSMSGIMSFPDDAFSILSDADMKFGRVKNDSGKLEELNENNYRKFIESTDRKVRKNAFKRLFKTYGNFKNTFATILAGEVKVNNKIAKIKGYNSALESSLYSNDIPKEIFANLIETVKKNAHYQSKYWKLKRNILNLDSLHLYDTFTPTTKNIVKKYSIEDAKKLILEALNVLGPTYTKDLERAFSDSWIDYCPNTSKRSGAYCTCSYNVHPYVLVNFNGTLNDVSTLSHELGHAMHYYYAQKNQEYQNYGYSIFVAEVASQVNQILLSKYLINKTDNIEEKKYLIDDLIVDFKSTIYRQTMFAEFEYKIHELESNGNILTHEVLSDLYYKLNQEYFGENIVIDKEIKYEWSRIPHFYMNFYVYQYATSYAAAIKIAMDILNKKDKSLEKYLEFLKLGSTKTPVESLKVAGVDMMDKNTLNSAFTYFCDLVNELEILCKEGE